MSHRQKLSKLIDERKKFSDEKYRFDFSDQNGFSFDDEDVVSGFSCPAFDMPPMLKFRNLIQAIFSWIGGKNSYSNAESQWFSEEGCKCEILLVKGGGWQKGRFRFRLEFIPDNPEAFLKNYPPEDEKPQSPLDDLRSQLNPE
ncbi:KGK domain-containing protein [Nostoc sp. 'Lobaria pulmonaria (5183) cyanobiont']|uniref:KGK domain-containing protein n=1 Tax=Nostoc sp. 'Lobaria pulmonaria (5183) cyanobiont' TaxID=1618022 RepID=UPI000CF307C0|nr:KGK domain-containing protein [Nostoc sp. 'Lobaria pulmonaria (5183) cyanobiont']AVH71577.1 KGK domain-containing protein [Nostoc sp. 'Lobaria pulmonaria (5183) cyanobiont']